MICSLLKSIGLLVVLGFFCGCKFLEYSSKPSNEPTELTQTNRPTDLKHHIRNNSASLLYDLLGDEKNLSKILIIKRESKQLNELVKRISSTAGDSAKKLEKLAQLDRTLNLHAVGLPSGEVATRDAISKTKSGELLHGKGNDFEFKLLLTQVEALNYGLHLAKVAAENSEQPEQVYEFSTLSAELKRLYEQVVTLLRSTALNQKPK